MDDLENMFFDEGENFSMQFNNKGNEMVPELLEYLINNINMVVAVGKSETPLIQKFEFYVKPPHDGSGGSDDNNDGGIPANPKPLPPRRPVEFELEA